MAFEDLIREAERFKLSKEVGGHWATIQLKLSSFSPEYLNVGVVFFSENGEVFSKVLDDYTGLKLLLPNQFDERQFDLLKELSEESILRAKSIGEIRLPSPSVRISNHSFFSGTSEKAIVDWLYEESITLSKCRKSRRGSQFVTKADSEIIKGLFHNIKEKDGVYADSYIRSDIYQKVDSSGNVHTMNVPLMTNDKVGTIANAWVKNWETMKLKVYDAQTDLSAVSMLSKRNGTLFIQRPENFFGIPNSELDSINENLDELTWKIERSGFEVISDLGIEAMANQIIGWAKAS